MKLAKVHAIIILIKCIASTDAQPSHRPAHLSQKQFVTVHPDDNAGTIIVHPLIPHKVHVDRRRRELNKRSGLAEFDTTSLPARPNISRHSLTPDNNEATVFALRGKKNHIQRSLQQQTGALYQGYASHYSDIWVGSPTPQRQTVIVDTGSGVTAFPCEGCKGCGESHHTNSYYFPSKSETFQLLECDECFLGNCAVRENDGLEDVCRISASYAEGSRWSAYEATDVCYAGGLHDKALTISNGPTANKRNKSTLSDHHIDPADASLFAFPLAFGCQVSVTGLFKTQLANGIMGLANHHSSFWKQMHLANAIKRPEFSLCFSHSIKAEKNGTHAGALTLGGYDRRLHTSPMVFAKNVNPHSGFYSVRLRAVYLHEGGGTLEQIAKDDIDRFHRLSPSEHQLNRGNNIVDSGTTDTFFTSVLASPFKKMWTQLTGMDYSTHSPIELTNEEVSKLPTIILVLQGFDGHDDVGDEPEGHPDAIAGYVGKSGLSKNQKDVVWAIPANHFMELDSKTGKYLPRINFNEEGGSVLGANAMMGHDIYFDIGRGRIGFAESSCDYASLVSSEEMNMGNDIAPTSRQESANEEASEEREEGKDSPKEESAPSEPSRQKGKDGGGLSGTAATEISDRSSGRRKGIILSLVSLGVAAVVIILSIRGAMMTRRRVAVVQQADLELSDLDPDLDSDGDDGHGEWDDGHGEYAGEHPVFTIT